MHAFYSRLSSESTFFYLFSEIYLIFFHSMKIVSFCLFNKEKDGPSRQKSREFKSEKKTLTPFDAVCKIYALRQGCPTGAPAFSCKKAGGNPEFTAVKVFLS